MFVVTVTFDVKPGREAELRARVQRQARDSLEREPDCHQFDVCIDPRAPGRVFLYELYTDEAFRTHLASAHFKDFDATVGDWLVSKQVATWQLADVTGSRS